MSVTLQDIRSAAARIAGRIEHTATVRSPSLSKLTGMPIQLKLESRQTTGSFKLRGATNAVMQLDDKARSKGVVAASTGNHGRALAYAAKLEGLRAVICMSKLVPANKIAEIEALGADVRIAGNSQDDAQETVERLVANDGLTMIPPFDHPHVVAGQGTLGLEMLHAVPNVAAVLVQLSGGGLASGIAAAIKSSNPKVRIIGVSMARGAAMKASLNAGKPVFVEELPTLADSLGGGIGLDNRVTFAMCRDLLDDVILLSEAEIAAAIRHLYVEEREIAEGAGAVGVAALLAGKVQSAGPIVALVSGRNIDMNLHQRIVTGEAVDAAGLAAHERVA